ncbi:uncharacterized protein F4812DRAFT_412242 [Daldinia caldariorum]|uniref:uncharacterized protein n=1 Tax=Daldinia caldariorum TaxID=326644 RepID=UPI002007CE90|nr:uncharacterized protein F4812DRAFT_412242 [Daldinia caldariorum]KAI1470990.1 hypothetical protein F4812DRAFT_412242 [Daldinia caldariorum]
MQLSTCWVILASFVVILICAPAEVHEGHPTLGEASGGTTSEPFTPYPNTSQTGLPTESFSHFPTMSFAPYPDDPKTSSPISFVKSASSIDNNTPIKDFRLQCSSNSLGLVESQARPGIYYLRGVCSGRYNDAHASRCSFLDLSMCYANDGGNILPRKMGNFLASCERCVLYISHGADMLACTCGRGDHNGGGTQESAVQLDNLLYVKNGFLSCHGYTNFECPEVDEPF